MAQQYNLMNSFNAQAAMMQQHQTMQNMQRQQQHQQQQQQQHQQPHDSMQQMQAFPDQARIWSQMQQQQGQFRPQNPSEMPSNPLSAQMNPDLFRVRAMAGNQVQQQTFSPLGVNTNSIPGPSQQHFLDQSAPQQPNHQIIQPPFNSLAAQNRNLAALQNFATNRNNPNVQRQLERMQAQQQQNANPTNMHFPHQITNHIAQQSPQSQQHSSNLPPGSQHLISQPIGSQQSGDAFSVGTMSVDSIRRPSPLPPHQPPSSQLNVQHPKALEDATEKLAVAQRGVAQLENQILQWNSARAGTPDALWNQKLKAMHAELTTRRDFLKRIHMAVGALQAASHNNNAPIPPAGNVNLNNAMQQNKTQNTWTTQNSQTPFNQPNPPTSLQQPNPPHHQLATNSVPNRPVTGQTNIGGIMPNNMVSHYTTNNSLPSMSTPPVQQTAQQSGVIPSQSLMPALGFFRPLDKASFDKSYKAYCDRNNVKYDPHPIVENRSIDLHALHYAVMQDGGGTNVSKRPLGWEQIGGKLGFVSFPGSDNEPARSGPTTALVISNIYSQQLATFESLFLDALNRRYESYRGVVNAMSPEKLQSFLGYARMSVQELHAKGIDTRVITWVENNRQNLLHTAEEQNFQTGARQNQMPDQSRQPSLPTAQPRPVMQGPNISQSQPPNRLPGQPGTFSRIGSQQQEGVQFIQRLKQEVNASHQIHSSPGIEIPPEQRAEYNNLVDQVARSATELENKIVMHQSLFKDTPQTVQPQALSRWLHLIVAAQHQRNLLSSNNPKLILPYEILRQMLPQLAQGHEQYARLIPNQSSMNVISPNTANLQIQPRPPNSQVTTPPQHAPAPHSLQSPQSMQSPAQLASRQPATPRQVPTKKPSGQPSTPAAGTPPAATPATAPTPTAAASPSTPKSPKAKVTPKPAKIVPSKQPRKVTKNPTAAIPEVSSSPSPSSGGVKRMREEEAPSNPRTPPTVGGPIASEPSPPKRPKTENTLPNDSFVPRPDPADTIKTTDEAVAYFEETQELFKKALAESAGSSDVLLNAQEINETWEMLIKGYGSGFPEGDPFNTSEGVVMQRESSPQPPIPCNDVFFSQFIDFSSCTNIEEDDSASKAATPDLVSSANPSPESEGELSSHNFNYGEVKDFTDCLRLGTLKEVDGGESTYYQPNEFKFDGPMPTLDPAWAIFASS